MEQPKYVLSFQMASIGSENPMKAALYTETNRKGEKLSKIAFVIVTIVIPIAFIFPPAIFAYSIYFTTDVGNDAFVLLYATWYVVRVC